MGGIVDLIFGKSPKTDTAPAAAVLDETSKSAKKSRAQVLATMGGINGQELDATQVSKQGTTLFGN